MPRTRITSVTLAKKLGLSQATVSMALRDNPLIHPDTRERVKKAAIQYNYIPNHMARSMKTGRSKILGILVPALNVSFYATAIDRIEQAAKKKSYYCFVAQTHSAADTLREEVQLLLGGGADGLIIYPINPHEQHDLYLSLVTRRVPFVLCDETLNNIKVPSVFNDNIAIGRIGTEHLLELGHKRIGCITGHLGTANGRGRLEGYRQAMLAAGLSITPDLVWEGSFARADAERCVMELCRQRVAFTALMTPNDILAAHTVRALHKNSIRVPSDVSIVGVGNLDIGTLTTPSLTTVDQCAEQMADTAVELLFTQLEAFGKEQHPQREIAPKLIVRESSAPVPAKPFFSPRKTR